MLSGPLLRGIGLKDSSILLFPFWFSASEDAAERLPTDEIVAMDFLISLTGLLELDYFLNVPTSIPSFEMIDLFVFPVAYMALLLLPLIIGDSFFLC